MFSSVFTFFFLSGNATDINAFLSETVQKIWLACGLNATDLCRVFRGKK